MLLLFLALSIDTLTRIIRSGCISFVSFQRTPCVCQLSAFSAFCASFIAIALSYFFSLSHNTHTHTRTKTIRHFNNFSLSERFKYKWSPLRCVLKRRRRKTSEKKFTAWHFCALPWCTANGALLRAIYNEMFKALEILNKRHFYSQVQSSFSVSGALVFIDTIQWNQHAQLKWWVVKKNPPTSTKAAMVWQWCEGNGYLTEQYTTNTMPYSTGRNEPTQFVGANRSFMGSLRISHRFLCSDFFSFEIKPIAIISQGINTKQIYLSRNSMLLRYSLHNMIYILTWENAKNCADCMSKIINHR